MKSIHFPFKEFHIDIRIRKIIFKTYIKLFNKQWQLILEHRVTEETNSEDDYFMNVAVNTLSDTINKQ